MDIVSMHLEALGLKHISYRQPFVRRLANSYNTKALEVLVDVIEPLKIYERNAGDTMYTVFSPLTKLADVAIPDPPLPRIFHGLVKEYLSGRSADLGKKISAQLISWKNNHSEFLLLIRNSPILKEAESLSENLSAIAASGLTAIQYLHDGHHAGKEWVEAQMNILQKAKESGGRCELQVIIPIEELVLAASDENVKVAPSFENTCLL
jgi:hexosaminidase